MSDSLKSEIFYNKLKSQLYATTTWPSEYMYKFIILSSVSKIEKVESLFNNLGAVINKKESKKGKYTSISINVQMKNPEAIIKKYKEVASKIEGVISL